MIRMSIGFENDERSWFPLLAVWNDRAMAEGLFEEEELEAYSIPRIPTQTIFVFLSDFENTAIAWQWKYFEEPQRPCGYFILFWTDQAQEWGVRVHCAKVIEIFLVLTQIIVLAAFDLKRTRPYP